MKCPMCGGDMTHEYQWFYTSTDRAKCPELHVLLCPSIRCGFHVPCDKNGSVPPGVEWMFGALHDSLEAADEEQR